MDQYVQTLIHEKRNANARHRRMYGAQRDDPIDQPLLSEEKDEEPTGFLSFLKKHTVLIIIASIAFIIVIICILVYRRFYANRKSEPKKEGFKEKYKATNKLNDEYEYVNSYINSVLGNSDDMTTIDENATSV